MGKRALNFLILILIVVMTPMMVLANPNRGNVLEPENAETVLEFSTGIEEAEYIDYLIPYKKTLWAIGGYSLEDTGLAKKLDESLYNATVGSIIGFQENSLLNVKYDAGIKDGLNIYSDGNGTVYYGVSLSSYFFDGEDLSEDLIGRLCDVVLLDGTCFHCVVCDFDLDYTRNGSSLYGDVYSYRQENEELGFSGYIGIFNASDGSVLKFIGTGNDSLKHEISGNNVSQVRVYKDKIDNPPSREQKNMVYEVISFDDKGVEYGEVEDEYTSDNNDGYYDENHDYGEDIAYDPFLEEDEEVFGKGESTTTADATDIKTKIKNHKYNKKKYVGSMIENLYSDEDRLIVLEHLDDFSDYDSFEKFIDKFEGKERRDKVKNYIKTWGGLYTAHYKKNFKIKTLGDVYNALDFLYGIWAVWGPCYDNPGYSMKKAFNQSNGGSKYAMWDTNRGYHGIGSGSLRSNAAGYRADHYDKWLTASVVCNTTTYNFFSIIRMERAVLEGGKLKYKVSSAFDIATDSQSSKRVEATKHYYGKDKITKVEDLRSMDVLLMSGHICFVIENDLEKNKLYYAETGQRFIGPAKFKYSFKYKKGDTIEDHHSSFGHTDLRAARIVDLSTTDLTNSKSSEGFDNSSKSEEKEQDSKRKKKLIPDEKDLVGLEGKLDKVSDDADLVSLPDRNSLDADELISVEVTNQDLNSRPMNKANVLFRSLVICLGLLLLVYIVLIVTAYIFDSVNTIFDIHLCSILTRGKVEGRVGDEDIDRSNFAVLLLICGITLLVSTLLITGGIYDIISVIYAKVMGFVR